MVEEKIESTSLIELAGQFINSTSRHIFLTGKAGTGKTTFLRNLSKATHKKFVIVAPTGIAALNAGGVTIHSQFLLPMGSYNPDEHAGYNEAVSSRFFNSRDLARRNPLNSIRKQVLRDIDLLIIDEVSMLRADILDAIDYRLRSARNNHRRPFGGVQLLLIGDLFQLPPIVKNNEWAVLRSHYSTPHFFSSLALQKDGYIYLELDKVFRQSEGLFIDILNNLRNNCCTQQDIAMLNSHYRSDAAEMDDAVTLTTHNRQADEINQHELQRVSGKLHSFDAKVMKDFPESMYPLPPKLEIKVGAQIMFVKNDTQEKRFYNGKLAKVISVDKEGIRVALSGEDRELLLEKMQWDNVKYSVNDSKELIEEVAGTFEQFPVKLAWAITVHKSQGLTFEKAVIDVGRAFAPGQVYVALSRLRSLDGLVLRTRINTSAITSDESVVNFQKTKDGQEELTQLLQKGRAQYLQEALHRSFNFQELVSQLQYAEQKSGAKMEFEDAEMRNALTLLREKLAAEEGNTRKFRNQLSNLLAQSDYDALVERIEKGSAYYLKFLYDFLYQLLLHAEEAAQFARVKTYVTALEEIEQIAMRKIADLQKAMRFTQSIISGSDLGSDGEEAAARGAKRELFLSRISAHIKENPRKGASNKTGRRRKKKGKVEKGATYQETYNLVKEGLDIAKIATKRSMAESTIEGHIARGIREGKVDIKKFMDENELKTIIKTLKSTDSPILSEVFAAFKGKYSYGKLRMVQAHFDSSQD